MVSEMVCKELYKTSVVCIDSYKSRVLSGRIFNPYLQAPVSFSSTIEFIREMNTLMQELKFPQSFSEKREFCSVQEPMTKVAAPTDSVSQKGRLATFSLRIMFRQNASWQGLLAWKEGKNEKSFRSVLELLLLIDSVLDHFDV